MKMMIQIRNVPAPLHRRLKARAAMEGLSMSAYVRRLIERSLERPGRQEILDALAALPEVTPDVAPADILRQARDTR